MASDEDYSAFLDKANEDTGSSQAQTQSKGQNSVKYSDTDVPGELERVKDLTPFQTETDEDWEPFALKWTGSGTLDVAGFAKLLCIDEKKVKVVSDENYDDVAKAVKTAGGDVFQRFEVTYDRTRVEMFYVTVMSDGKRVAGFRAKGIRS